MEKKINQVETTEYKIQFPNHEDFIQHEDFEVTYSRFTPEEIDFQLALIKYNVFRLSYPLD